MDAQYKTMKPKFQLCYWDNIIDQYKVVGCKTYEEAFIKGEKAKAKGHGNIKIKLRGA
jgi:hypothetical protein